MGWADNDNLGAESLLGVDAEGEAAQDVRDRLALASRYLANWYRATKGSDDQATWWQRIDDQRRKVEDAYELASASGNELFLGTAARAAYVDAAAGWPQLWRDLKLSADTLPEPSLLDQAASLASAPFAMLPTLGNELGKAIGGALGSLVRQLFPYILVAGAAGVVYVFRAPIMAVVAKVTK